MDWKPSSASVACNIGAHCSNSQPKEQPTYTFGHGVKPGQATNPVAEDAKAAMWWKGGHANNPTTNDARNSDVAEFWQTAKNQGAGSAVEHLTGKDIAKRVKEAGRGSHVTLGVDGDEFTRVSKYKQEFCEKHEAKGAQSIKPAVEDMYFEAKKQAQANKALGRGSSVNISYMH